MKIQRSTRNTKRTTEAGDSEATSKTENKQKRTAMERTIKRYRNTMKIDSKDSNTKKITKEKVARKIVKISSNKF